MGTKLIDQYTYLHFATGIIFYYWGVSLKTGLLLHTIFELVENSDLGMLFINSYFGIWPGGKPYADTFINSIDIFWVSLQVGIRP